MSVPSVSKTDNYKMLAGELDKRNIRPQLGVRYTRKLRSSLRLKCSILPSRNSNSSSQGRLSRQSSNSKFKSLSLDRLHSCNYRRTQQLSNNNTRCLWAIDSPVFSHGQLLEC